MNALFKTETISGAFAPAETSPFDAETTNTKDSIKESIDFACSRPFNPYIPEILQGLAWVLLTLYFVGASALGVTLLYYTLVR